MDKARSELVQAALERGIPLSSEMNLFLERCPARRVAGVTGSAGKSTTTAMLGAILARREKGDPLVEACRWGAAAGAVNAGRLEICQFACELVEDLLPSVKMERVDR